MAKKSTFKLEEGIPFLVHRLASRLSSVANERFRAQGINIKVARVLLVLRSNEDATVQQLCEATAIDQSTMSHMLNRLMAKQLITKEREDADNRTVRVALTAKGAKMAATCATVASNYEEKAEATLSPRQVAELRQMLATIYRNFDDAV